MRLHRPLVPAALLALALAGCGSTAATPAAGVTASVGAPPSSAGSAVQPTATALISGTPGAGTPSGGTDQIGGAVTANIGAKPTIKVPTGPPPTTLQTKTVVEGTGQVATAGDTVKVQYVGVNYADGMQFDASWDHGSAASFSLAQVVPGFAQGITGMKVGGRREIVIPPDLGYGPQGNPPAIQPSETLVFVVDLLGVSQGS